MSDRGDGFLTYAKVLERIMLEFRKEENLAPIIIAGIRELRRYPEFSDATVLFLDEIDVAGNSHFDHLLRTEITSLENFLLEVSGE